MVRVYWCNACEKGDHKNCEGSTYVKKGQFGGSRCLCNHHTLEDTLKWCEDELQKYRDYEERMKDYAPDPNIKY